MAGCPGAAGRPATLPSVVAFFSTGPTFTHGLEHSGFSRFAAACASRNERLGVPAPRRVRAPHAGRYARSDDAPGGASLSVTVNVLPTPGSLLTLASPS